MPKATWGSVSADEIDGAERSETRTRYSGEMPRGGTYRFAIQSIKQAESKAGNPKAVITLALDGSWKPNHKQYDGCPVWDHLPIAVTERLANFLDAIGATGKDFANGTLVDENKYVTKMGRVGDPKGILVYVNIKRDKQEGYDTSLKVDYNGYMMVDESDDGDGDAPATGDDGTEPPF